MSFKQILFVITTILIVPVYSSAQNLKNFSKDKTFFIDELKGMFSNDKYLDKDKKKRC